jgi:hypothetical protein
MRKTLALHIIVNKDCCDFFCPFLSHAWENDAEKDMCQLFNWRLHRDETGELIRCGMCLDSKFKEK